MAFYIILGMVIGATIWATIIVAKDGESFWFILPVTAIAALMGFIILCFVGLFSQGRAAESIDVVSEKTYTVADNSTMNIDTKKTEFFYLDENKHLQKFSDTIQELHILDGGNQKEVRVVKQREELGTSVVPWGESRSETIVYVK